MKRQKVLLLERTDSIRFFLLGAAALTLVACKSPRNSNKYEGYVEIVSNADSTVNELSAVSKSEELNAKLNNRFQSISENRELEEKIPEKRVEEKAELLQECHTNPDLCKYVPEGYSFETNQNFLNLTYQCNAFGSHDLLHKHAVIDLEEGRRILYLNMFNDPSAVLEKYNQKYVEENEAYLAEFAGSYLSDEEQEEYDIIRNHLDSRAPFELHNLNNCEFIFDVEENRFTEIRFHYSGSGGIYKPILSGGYISFTLDELDHFLLKEFKNQIGERK